MTHERYAGLEGGEHGEHWHADAASITPTVLDSDDEIGSAQLPPFDPAALVAALEAADREVVSHG
jgi:hypothetical protein